jgi:hypothetical protein
VFDFGRSALDEIREAGLGLGVCRLGQGAGHSWRGGEVSAGQFNEFPAGVLL